MTGNHISKSAVQFAVDALAVELAQLERAMTDILTYENSLAVMQIRATLLCAQAVLAANA